MSDFAIRVNKVSKRYRIGQQQKKNNTLAGAVMDWFKRPVQNLRQLQRLTRFNQKGFETDVIWALKEVSFEVKRGEVIGVIGKNGAGKSTLLKILSRITQPTSGRVELRGRVSSLLEVGTGFHPELTGRENIYLNGTILGMNRKEIHRKFDEIVDFSGVEKFIDTPVKRYSSGMTVRLAFSVAAHLEPEILLVDEVLAVGDADFQKKCIGKMGEVAKGGRTVLFVSHNMAAINSLCVQGLVLERGEIRFTGSTIEAIKQYQESLEQGGLEKPSSNGNTPAVTITRLRIESDDGVSVFSGQGFTVSCKVESRDWLAAYDLFCILQDGSGQVLVHTHTDDRHFKNLKFQGAHQLSILFPTLWIKPGIYNLHVKIIATPENGAKGRFLSDNLVLRVMGTAAGESLLGSLTPAVDWVIESDPS